MAEACALNNAVEHGLRTRAFIIDMRGKLNIRQWRETAAAAMGHVWFTDCESLFSHLISTNTKQIDNKRLAIDLSALKQLILDNRDDCDEKVDSSKGNYPRWIDTCTMLADCLTKNEELLSTERNVGHRYLRYETHNGKSRYQSEKQTVKGIEERTKNDRRIPTIDMLITPVLNIGIARLRHNIIKFDIALVAQLRRSVKSAQRRLMSQIALTRHQFSIPRTVTHF